MSRGGKAGDEVKIAGRSAVLAACRHRLDDVIRLYVLEEHVRLFAPFLERLAASRRAYHVVGPEELERVAETVHHEGVCALVRQKRLPTFQALLRTLEQDRGPCTLVLLENVRNPHNLGAILRVGAHFGVRAVIASGDESLRLTPSLLRTAEGGAEVVDVAVTSEPARALDALTRRGFTAYATSSHVRSSVFDVQFAPRSVLLFGAESEGLSNKVLAYAGQTLVIPGTGEVESLNVATAAAVVLAEVWRGRARARSG